MRKILFFLTSFLVLSVLSLQAIAAGDLHEALDRRYRFSKHLQSEASLYGGDFLGDETHNSWDVGAKYYLHLNNTFAIGAAYAYTPIYTDFSSTFGKSLRTKKQHIIDGEMMIANDAAFRAGNSIVECDLFLTIGAGTMWINRHYEPLGVIGGGLKIYTGVPWFALRFDVNTYIHPTPNPTGDTINADMSINLGASFLFPQRLPPQSE